MCRKKTNVRNNYKLIVYYRQDSVIIASFYILCGLCFHIVYMIGYTGKAKWHKDIKGAWQ